METTLSRQVRSLALGICSLCILSGSTQAGAQELFPQEPSISRPLLDNPRTHWGPDYTNWVEISVGNFWVDGSRAEFQRRHYLPEGLFGGLEGFHFEQRVGERGLAQVDGRAMFGEQDFQDHAVSLSYSHEGLGFVRGGYREYTVYYDRHGGFLPRFDVWTEPFSRDVHLDRGELWFEAGLRLENVPQVTFRYTHQFRDGMKDSTLWGDYNVNIGTTLPADRYNIVPAYRDFDEERNIFELNARHQVANTGFGAGVRYEKSDMQNHLYIIRRPGEQPPLVTPGSERVVHQQDVVDYDIFTVHAFIEQRISPKALFTSGYMFTTLDTDLRGSRIVGEGFDPVYDPLFSRRQPFDEGFLNLTGGHNLYQHTANLNLLLKPWEHLSILPSARFSKEDQDGDSWFIETNVGPAPARAAITDRLYAENEDDFLDVTGALELRYTGLTNWVFYTRGEWTRSNGDTYEFERDITAGEDHVVLDMDQDRFTQKYSAGVNWYPIRRVNVGLQYYHKIHNADYDNRLDTPGYPGYIRDQDFETDDANIRLSLRPMNNLTLVTRFDIQLSTIDTESGEFREVQSGRMRSHIISQSISWAPLNRLYFQASGTYARDETESPVDRLAPPPGSFVRDARNDYMNASVLAGISLDDRTDLQLQYFFYYADNDLDQGVESVPYNSSSEEHGVSASLTRQLTAALRWTLKYAYFTNNDDTFGGNKDYDAHLVYSSMQLRF
jgi:hypothetical protein